jgi:hypothetical protein
MDKNLDRCLTLLAALALTLAFAGGARAVTGADGINDADRFPPLNISGADGTNGAPASASAISQDPSNTASTFGARADPAATDTTSMRPVIRRGWRGRRR